ncbi:glycine cleavage T C-terminal barrel domain-containing protein [Aestuariispira ectoiniformans]|uniref:glycine cleavage T C-terminal barrel domain-containing protein n=1 Tax=Aestuariispira ectoiniformans TaxID=2775080 RepID=UPI00223B659C|nr:glycine cleavage T C-terminal barrel domain-containing protein [Aestuariispira ectoiniformans]
MTQDRSTPRIAFGNRVRKSPFFDATMRSGVKAFTVYNHMHMPAAYFTAEEEYHNLTTGVTLWDVAVERQVEIHGPDAAAFAQYLTPRNLSAMKVGQCKYALICDEAGMVLNDPILLKLAEDRFWFSLADSDILLWAKALAFAKGFDVLVLEPDVSPLQVQGPKSADVVRALFGDWIDDLKYYWFREVELDGVPVVLSRTGWSSEKGYEVFLRDGSKGDWLWDRIMSVGKAFGIKPGVPNTIRRIEGGMYSVGSDFWMDASPYELGLGRLVDLDMEADFVGKAALAEIKKAGVRKKMVGLQWQEPRLGESNGRPWPVFQSGKSVGDLLSAVYSPRLEKNIALAMLDADCALSSTVTVETHAGKVDAEITSVPFYDPKKELAAGD